MEEEEEVEESSSSKFYLKSVRSILNMTGRIMDEIKNPFSPGAGSPPPELVGRSSILRQTEVLLGRTLNRRPEKSMLLTGLRGVGKTVLLNEMERLAQQCGYHTISIEAHENKSLGACLAPYLRRLFFELNRLAGTGD